jgi:hypothetical protein
MGFISDNKGVTACLYVLVICVLYVGFATWYAIRTKNRESFFMAE